MNVTLFLKNQEKLLNLEPTFRTKLSEKANPSYKPVYFCPDIEK